MTDLERMIYNQFKKHGNEKCFVDDFVSMFPGRSKYEIQRALDNLVRTNMLYSIDTYVGKIYGIDDYEYGGESMTFDVDGTSVNARVFNTVGDSNKAKALVVPNFPKYASDHDSSIKRINDSYYLNMSLTKKNFSEWNETIDINFAYLPWLKQQACQLTANAVASAMGSFDWNAQSLFKEQIKAELAEIAKIRVLYYKEMIQVYNVLVKKDPTSEIAKNMYTSLLQNLNSSINETVEVLDMKISVPIVGMDALKKSVVNPNNATSSNKNVVKNDSKNSFSGYNSEPIVNREKIEKGKDILKNRMTLGYMHSKSDIYMMLSSYSYREIDIVLSELRNEGYVYKYSNRGSDVYVRER